MKTCSLILIFALIGSKVAHADSHSPDNQAVEHASCYGHLTELVRSSDFPFGQVGNRNVNLIIDNDTGNSVLAKLFFDTHGTGTIGWIEYHVDERKLFNVSAYLDGLARLNFSEAHAVEYEECTD